jgi:DNA-binding MarR family transcriptional regulator
VAIAKQFEVPLPDCLPILKYGLTNDLVCLGKSGPGAREAEDIAALPLPFLLARVLLAFAVEFERESSVSLAIYSDVLRVLDEKGTAVSEISSLSGVSKEAVAMALGFLAKRGYLRVLALEGKRGKRALLAPPGVEALEACSRLMSKVERHWSARYGNNRSRSCGAAWTASRVTARRKDRRCLPVWNPIRMAGGLRCPSRRRCRTSPWSCIAAATPTVADSASRFMTG